MMFLKKLGTGQALESLAGLPQVAMQQSRKRIGVVEVAKVARVAIAAIAIETVIVIVAVPGQGIAIGIVIGGAAVMMIEADVVMIEAVADVMSDEVAATATVTVTNDRAWAPCRESFERARSEK